MGFVNADIIMDNNLTDWNKRNNRNFFFECVFFISNPVGQWSMDVNK